MLYFNERGRVLFARNEEIWRWARTRKRLRIEASDGDGELCIFACEYPGNEHPLEVTVGGIGGCIAPCPELQGKYHWHTFPVPAHALGAGDLDISIGCDAPSMRAWILGVDCTGNTGASLKSIDGGKSWRADGMGHDGVLNGEYVVRLWTPGDGLRHPDLPFVHEDPGHPRLAELRDRIGKDVGQLTAGDAFVRALALQDWVAAQWKHHGGAPGSAYSAWEAGTILDWTRTMKGHGHEDIIAFCVHFAVAYVQFALAIGLEARLAFSEESVRKAGGGHCVPEVFCPELDRWVMLDPDTDTHPEHGGEPISALTAHKLAVSGRGDEVDIVPGPRHASLAEESRTFWSSLWSHELFHRVGILPRNDFFSNPVAFPCEHGRLQYHCTDILWYDGGEPPPNRWFPYFSADEADFEYHRCEE